jgi:hypothetical protein
MSRIGELEKDEELKKIQPAMKLDKESSARIIKRSLWMNAQQQQNGQGKSSSSNSVSDLVNKTIESGHEKRHLEELNEPNKKLKTE